MGDKKYAVRAILAGAVVLGFQAVSLAIPGTPTIYFQVATGTAPGGLTQLTNVAGPSTSANQGIFSPTPATANTVMVTGSVGSYLPGYVNSINTAGNGDGEDYVHIDGFTPPTDTVEVALKLDDDGSYITPKSSEAEAIIADLQLDSGVYATFTASDIPASLGGQFPGYDVLLTFAEAPGAATAGTPQFDFGFNFPSDYAPTGGTGPITVTNLGVVPEPASLGLMGVSGIVLLAKRRRRTA